MSQKKFLVLITFIISGFFMGFVPSPLDIGETILIQLSNTGICQTEQCIQNQTNLLSYYNLGGFIIGIGSILELIRELRK